MQQDFVHRLFLSMNKLPTYEMVIEENPESEVEVSFIALVDKPAIEKNFMAFKDIRLDFATDIERQIISGPAMVADSLIYRRDAGGEYNVFFSKETIQEIAIKFFKKDYAKNLNLFHDPTLSLQGVTIFESFVSDKARGIQPMKGYEDLPDGTWFISAKVENPDVWAKIKTGEVKGFSVEGIFSYMKKPKVGLSATDEGKGLFTQIDIMSLAKELADKFKKQFFDGTPLIPPAAPAPVVPVTPQVLNTDYQLKDGTAVTIDKLEVGGVALVGGVPAPAGEHELADGTKVTVGEGGVITLVTPAMAAAPEPAFSEAQMSAVNEAIANALNAYKEEMAAEKLAAQTQGGGTYEAIKAEVAKQDEKIKGLFAIIEEMNQVPTADAVGDTQLSFSQQKNTDRESRLKALVSNIKKLKTA